MILITASYSVIIIVYYCIKVTVSRFRIKTVNDYEDNAVDIRMLNNLIGRATFHMLEYGNIRRIAKSLLDENDTPGDDNHDKPGDDKPDDDKPSTDHQTPGARLRRNNDAKRRRLNTKQSV